MFEFLWSDREVLLRKNNVWILAKEIAHPVIVCFLASKI